MESVTYWHWWILAAALIILEVFAPGAFFLWLGIAAGVVGGLIYLAPALGWEYQVLVFSVLSVASILVWRRYFRTTPEETDEPALNRRGEQYVGRRLQRDHHLCRREPRELRHMWLRGRRRYGRYLQRRNICRAVYP
jgi:membrane protein implicated in regulation of membrane protease activity